MGIFNKIKGALNIGGVSVKFTNVQNPFPLSSTIMTGTYELSSKSEREVLSIIIKFTMFKKRKDNQGEEQNEEIVLGKWDSKWDTDSQLDFPFTMQEGETRSIDFTLLNINVEKRDQDEKGIVGSLSKFNNFLHSEDVSYVLEVEADVKGTPLDPSDEQKIKIDINA